MTAVTWFDGSSNPRHAAFSIPHFTFRIPQFRILPTTRFIVPMQTIKYLPVVINGYIYRPMRALVGGVKTLSLVGV